MLSAMQNASVPGGAWPAWLTTRPIAHRGLHDKDRPENTCAAFAAALAHGYPIELDIHVLPDGEVIVFHDEDLRRATGLARPLALETRTSIRAHRVFGSAEGIPTLAEVLALVNGQVPLLIEIKAHGIRSAFGAPILELLEDYEGPFAIQSFNPWALVYFRKHAPHILRGQLGGPLHGDGLRPFDRWASQYLLTCFVSHAHFVNYDLRALPDAWVTQFTRAFSLPLLAWTVRSEEDKRRAEALSVNYVFDNVRP